ncbi:alpha/beta hydrolase [Actinocrispum sp. NPDC049592]|uniref:alpha/beta fold hydrolase n=1 Tax=Actinocrispum sp. NPDC049592 TaxID=3154835 RepID=UPI00343E6158
MKIRTHFARAAAITAAVALFGAAGVASSAANADNRHPSGAKPTIVLVHGAFADGSSWNGVIERLRQRGYNVIAPANPRRGVASDAAYIKALVDSVQGPVVLVGHSYGGQVATNAAAGEEGHVKALVYVAAFIPEVGESAVELSNKFPGSTLGQTLQEVPLPGGDTDLYVKQDLFWKQFAADVPQSEGRLMAATQRPIAKSALAEPSAAAAWKTIPSWSIIPTADKNIPPASERFMSKRAHSKTTEVPGASHAVLVSEPKLVANTIIEAAQTTTH